jgi:hypothetical protein
MYITAREFFFIKECIKKILKKQKLQMNNKITVFYIKGVKKGELNKLKLKFPSNFIAVFWKVFIFMGY